MSNWVASSHFQEHWRSAHEILIVLVSWLRLRVSNVVDHG